MISKARSSITGANPAIYVVLTISAVAALIPFIWMLMTSVKTFGDTLSLTIWPWPPFGKSVPQFNNFGDAIRQIGVDRETGLPLFVRQFLNTSFVTAVIVVGVTTTSIMAAYAFANLEFPGKRFIFLIVLLTLMFPDDLTLIPRAVMMFKNYLDWYDSYLALTIPFIASAFGIFLVRQFMMQIPADLFDAAQIDGAGHIRYLTQIVIPLARPAIVTIALFHFIWTWNEFKWTQLVTKDVNMRTVSVGMQDFLQGDGGTNAHLAMAVAVMVVLPIILLYLFTQKYFTEGITTTGLKG
ncbi:MAG: carbohydrate ABC transporter permease [Chloroflexota bacterium]|jgi:ABC-type glycerol-3-phosphate transport system permease component|nr:carbohydrate ABC transporter permease [Chloroflexota bacterium]